MVLIFLIQNWYNLFHSLLETIFYSLSKYKKNPKIMILIDVWDISCNNSPWLRHFSHQDIKNDVANLPSICQLALEITSKKIPTNKVKCRA